MTTHSSDNVLRTYNFFINSEQRNLGTNSNFVISLNQTLALQNYIPSEFHVYIDRAQIPFSWSQFNEKAGNIQASWRLTRLGTVTVGTFMIEEGNYNVYSLADEFINKIRASIGSIAVPHYVPVINYLYDTVNNRLTFFLDGAGTTIEILDAPYSGLNRALGFGASWTMTAGLIGTVGTRDVDVSPSKCLYVTSSSLLQSQNFAAIDNRVGLSQVLTMIPLDRTPLIFIQHKPSYVVKTTLVNTFINEIQLTLRDDIVDELVEFDIPWQCHIVIEEVRTESFLSRLYTQLGEFNLPRESNEETMRREELLDMDFRERQEMELLTLRDKLMQNVEQLQQSFEKKREKRKSKQKKIVSRKGKDVDEQKNT